MTVEEIEIIVTTKVEEALKNFMKLAPAFKQQVKQIKETVTEVDVKVVQNKAQQAVQFVKNKVQELKKSNNKDKVQLNVSNEEAQKQVTQLQKMINSLNEKINARQMNLNVTNGALDQIRENTKQGVIKDMPDAGAKRINQQTELRLYNDDNYMNLVKQSDKLNNEILKYNVLLDSAKDKMAELGKETTQTATTQNKLSSFFDSFKNKLEQAKTSTRGIKGTFNQLPKITQNVTNNIKGMGTSMKQGLRHILKYAAALFSLRGIYSVLSSSAQSWLSSQNAQAQQLSTNIEYMKYAMRKCICTNYRICH